MTIRTVIFVGALLYSLLPRREGQELRTDRVGERNRLDLAVGYDPLLNVLKKLKQQVMNQEARGTFTKFTPTGWKEYSSTAGFLRVHSETQEEAEKLFLRPAQYNGLVEPARRAGRRILSKAAGRSLNREIKDFYVVLHTREGQTTSPTFDTFLLTDRNPLDGESEYGGAEILRFEFATADADPHSPKETYESPRIREEFDEIWDRAVEEASRDKDITELRMVFESIDNESEALLREVTEAIEQLRTN